MTEQHYFEVNQLPIVMKLIENNIKPINVIIKRNTLVFQFERCEEVRAIYNLVRFGDSKPRQVPRTK